MRTIYCWSSSGVSYAFQDSRTPITRLGQGVERHETRKVFRKSNPFREINAAAKVGCVSATRASTSNRGLGAGIGLAGARRIESLTRGFLDAWERPCSSRLIVRRYTFPLINGDPHLTALAFIRAKVVSADSPYPTQGRTWNTTAENHTTIFLYIVPRSSIIQTILSTCAFVLLKTRPTFFIALLDSTFLSSMSSLNTRLGS